MLKVKSAVGSLLVLWMASYSPVALGADKPVSVEGRATSKSHKYNKRRRDGLGLAIVERLS